MVHVRKIGDKTFTFIVSGKLWRNSLIMQDKETGSLWSHVTGESLDGAMKGRQLDYVPSVQTTWADWLAQHPETKVLRKEKAVRSSSYEKYFKDPDKSGIFRTRWLVDRMPGKRLVHGISRGTHALAIADEKLVTDHPINVAVGKEPLLVIRTRDGGVRAYLSKAEDRTLHFRQSAPQGVIQDEETASTWNPDTGICTQGELQGSRLDEVVVRTAFWFAWSSFYPNTKVVD